MWREWQKGVLREKGRMGWVERTAGRNVWRAVGCWFRCRCGGRAQGGPGPQHASGERGEMEGARCACVGWGLWLWVLVWGLAVAWLLLFAVLCIGPICIWAATRLWLQSLREGPLFALANTQVIKGINLAAKFAVKLGKKIKQTVVSLLVVRQQSP